MDGKIYSSSSITVVAVVIKQDWVSFSPSVAKAGEMQIFVKTLTGKTLMIETEPRMTIEEVINLVHQANQSTPEAVEVKIIFRGRALHTELGRTLADFNIQKESAPTVILKLRHKDEVASSSSSSHGRDASSSKCAIL